MVFLVIRTFACLPQLPSTHLEGRIVGVTDGDTVTLLDIRHSQHKLRLAGIDAPEIRMPYGQRAKQHLATLVFGRNVLAIITKQDRYGRAIATIRVNGADVNLQMIEVGLAWHYSKYSTEQTCDMASQYFRAEQVARAQAFGLWNDPNPIAPWDWRTNRMIVR